MPVNSFADYPVSWRPEIPAGAGHGGDGRGHERRAAVYSVADIRIDCAEKPNLTLQGPAAQMCSRALCWGGYA